MWIVSGFPLFIGLKGAETIPESPQVSWTDSDEQFGEEVEEQWQEEANDGEPHPLTRTFNLPAWALVRAPRF